MQPGFNHTIKNILLTMLLGISFLPPSSGAENYLSGSRFSAMANASVMVPDIWSVAHNQAGLAYINRLSFSLHYENKFILPQYGLNAVALAVPVKPGTIGICYYYFGYTRYHETKTGLSFGKSFGEKFSAGVQLNYHSIHISDEYGRSSTLSVEGGLMFQPIKDLFIGTHVFNPSRSGFKSPEGDELLPVIFRFGAGYTFYKIFTLNLETQKQDEQKAVWKAGAEIEAVNNLFLRAGIASDPLFNTVGVGYEAVGLRGDIAFSFHPQLGFTPHFTLSYSIK